jgi:hypothetical protein
MGKRPQTTLLVQTCVVDHGKLFRRSRCSCSRSFRKVARIGSVSLLLDKGPCQRHVTFQTLRFNRLHRYADVQHKDRLQSENIGKWNCVRFRVSATALLSSKHWEQWMVVILYQAEACSPHYAQPGELGQLCSQSCKN